MGASEPPLLPGLELLRSIGRGSFGEVWLARTVTGQYRAVKLVPLGAKGSGLQALGERVFRGVQAYLDHLPPGSPAALAVLHVDHDPAGRFLYYVMELADDVAGGRAFAPEHYQALTLSEFRRRAPGQLVPAPETIRLGRQLAEGLATLHAAGLVHRDIKPNNVVFIGGEPRLADIDLVRPAEASLSLGGAQGYSPLEGPGRPTADVFSLGRTLYATVTGLQVGEFPCLPEDWDQRPDAADLQRLNAVLLRACDPDPARRHQHGAELAEDFRRLERGEDVERSRQQRSRSRRLTLAATLLVAALAVALTAIVPAYRKRGEQAEFERYREQINSAERNLLDSEWPNASKAIIRTIGSPRAGIEADILKRQSEDAESAASATNIAIAITQGYPLTPIEELAFSSDGKLLAARNGTKIDIYSLPDCRRLSAITNAASLVGFVQPGNQIVGIGRESDGSKPICLWDSDTGVALPQRLPGNWIPAGILGDGQTVVALPFSDRHRTLVRWLPLSGVPASSDVWNPGGVIWWGEEGIGGYRAIEHPEPVALINRAGDRMVFKEYRSDYPKVELPNGKRVFAEGEVPIDVTTIAKANFNWEFRYWEVISLEGHYARLAKLPMSASGEWLSFIDPMTQAGRLEHLWGSEVRAHGFTAVEAMAASFDADMVAVAGNGNQLILADGKTGSTRAQLEGHGAKVSALAWGNQDTLLASGDRSGLIRLWHVPTPSSALRNQRRRTHRQARIVTSLDESLLALGVPTPEKVPPGCNVSLLKGTSLKNHLWKSGWGADGAEVMEPAAMSDVGYPLSLTAKADEMWEISPSGKLVCETTSKRIVPPEESWIIRPREYLFETKAFSSSTTNAAGVASPDGQRLALYADSLLSLWITKATSARRIAETNHPTGAKFNDAVISTDSRWAVVLAADGSALLADLDSGATRLLKQLNEKAVTACFRPDSTECYFGTSGGRLLRLDTATDDPPELLDANFGLPAHMIATPDGGRLLTAGPGEQLGIRRLPDGAPIVHLTHHGLALEPGRHNLKRLLYLPKQQRVLSLSEDGWLTQW